VYLYGRYKQSFPNTLE
jgi:hypothetical protein